MRFGHSAIGIACLGCMIRSSACCRLFHRGEQLVINLDAIDKRNAETIPADNAPYRQNIETLRIR